MCYRYGDFYFATVVVAGCGSKYCREGIDACIAHGGGCICTLDAPCTDCACGKLENRYEVAIGCTLRGDHNVLILCRRYGYGNRLFSCEVVCTFLNAEGYGVGTCIDDLFNGCSVLGDHNGKCFTVRCRYTCDGVFLGVIYLGVGIVCTVDGNACLCNGEADGFALCSDQVFVTLCDCLNVISTCVCGNGCCVFTVDCSCINVRQVACKVGVCGGYVCLCAKRPAVDGKIADDDLCLDYFVGQLYVFGRIGRCPLVVVLILENERCGIGCYVCSAVIGYGVFFRIGKSGGQNRTVIYLCQLRLGNFGNGYCLLCDAEFTRCYQILIVGIGCCESCYVCACVRGNGCAVRAVIGSEYLIFNGYGSCKSFCISCIACVTIYPRIDARLGGPLVICRYNSVGQCLICACTVRPHIVVADECYRYGMGANVNGSVVGNYVALCIGQSRGQDCACEYLFTVVCRNCRCVDSLLCYRYGDFYFATVVVAGCRGINGYKRLSTCIANGSCFIGVLNTPSSLNACGECNLFEYKITVGCGLGKDNVFDVICFCNRYCGCNHCCLIVSGFGQRNGNGVNTCVGKGINCLAVLLVCKYQFALGVRTGNGIKRECSAVVNEIVVCIYVIDGSGCFCYVDFELTGYCVVVYGILGCVDCFEAVCACGGNFGCGRIYPRISCGKGYVGKLERFGPDCTEYLLKVGYGIDLVNGECNYLGCGVVLILKRQCDFVNTCIFARCVTENNKIVNSTRCLILDNARECMFCCAVVIKDCATDNFDNKLLGSNRDFNSSFDNVISAIGRCKHSNVGLLTGIANQIIGVLPSPLTVRVRAKLDDTDQIAVCNNTRAECGICNLKCGGIDGNDSFFYLENKVLVGSGCR